MIPYVSPKSSNKLTQQGPFLIGENGESYDIIKGIPRFVPLDNYAAAFGLQWKTFAKTQLDSHTGHPISEVRLERCLGEPLEHLRGKLVLEVGSGAGRFTEILLKYGAFVHTLDYSEAVEANKENIGEHPNYQICQADIRQMPYPNDTFDFVICLGVVQHTPNSEESITSLFSKVKPNGKLVFDHYRQHKGLYTSLYLVYWQIIKRFKPTSQIKLTDALTNFFFPIHWFFRDSG